jgi:hypothetical protein
MDAIAPMATRDTIGEPPIRPAQRRGGARIVMPLENRLEAYARFQKLSARGKSTHEIVCTISKRFGVSQDTVYAWTRGRSPFGRRAGRVAVTKELFYVVGSLLGDGCIYFWKKTYTVWLLGEKEFCSKYAGMVPWCTSKTKAKVYPYRGRNVWFVKFQNAELYFLIRKIREDLSALSNLLKRGDRFKNSLSLIEGFFDAEGCVKVIKEEVRRTPKINLDFCNTNLALLELIRRELKNTLGIQAHLTSQKYETSNRKVCYHLRIYKKDAIRKFLLYVSTIKLKPEKVQYVENWLRK